MSGYGPREGSSAGRAIEHMQASEPGTRFTANQLAEVLDVHRNGIATSLRKFIAAGLIECEREGNQYTFWLPGPATEPEVGGPLAINSDSSGDVWFQGAVIDSDGNVLLKQVQLQQLVDYATTPPLKLQPPGRGAES